MWMLPDELLEFGLAVAAVAMFGSNFLFDAQNDNFSPSVENNPLLHTWSLSVEEQFYVIFPIARNRSI